jgi:hypothetical protein
VIGTSVPHSLPSELVSADRPQQKLTEHKQQQQHSGYKSPESESISLGSFSGTNGHKDGEDSLGERDSPLTTIAKDEVIILSPMLPLSLPVFLRPHSFTVHFTK